MHRVPCYEMQELNWQIKYLSVERVRILSGDAALHFRPIDSENESKDIFL